jgi:8-oxo-dGTP pyrophosphatase MutT (NUDIX family)
MAVRGSRGHGVLTALARFGPRSAAEAADVERIRTLAGAGDPWARSSPLHVTGSALVVHPPSGRVLLRWHDRMRAWLQLGGHGDPGETDPFAVAVREAAEETGLSDLMPWPEPSSPMLLHVVIVTVPAGRGEPDHEHADLRYLLATDRPDDVTPESASATLRWLTIDEALAVGGVDGEDNLRTTLARAGELV